MSDSHPVGMYRVVAHRIRNDEDLPERKWIGYVVVVPPTPGVSMCLMGDNGKWMATSAVRRVLRSQEALYVETDNSTYRLVVEPHQPPAFGKVSIGPH